MTQKQVMVIGGGIIGLCSAYTLQKQGYHVSVIDPMHQSANNASSASAGIIGGSAVVPWAKASLWSKIPAMLLNPTSPLTLSFPYPRNLLSYFYQCRIAGEPERFKASAAGLALLGLSGNDNWMALLDELDDASTFFKQAGCYFVYLTEVSRANDRKNIELRKEFGMQMQDLNSADTATAIPPLVTTKGGAVKVVKAGHVVDPLGLQKTIRSEIERRGGQIISSSVTHFENEDSRVCKVCTTDRKFRVDHVVIAAGCGSAHLARKLGSKVPMLPGHGYSLRLVGANVHLDAPMLFLDHGIAVTPAFDGIRVAGLVSIGGNSKRTCEKNYGQLLKFAESLFADLKYQSVVYHTGARPLTTDSLPVISQSPNYSNVWFNFGHGHWGMTQAASSAKVLAEMFDEDTPLNGSNPFDVSRF